VYREALYSLRKSCMLNPVNRLDKVPKLIFQSLVRIVLFVAPLVVNDNLNGPNMQKLYRL
jgi:hypothetical protein